MEFEKKVALEELLKSGYEIPLGKDVSLKVLATEYYCRYGNEYSAKEFKRNRAGFWFLMALQGPGGTLYIVDGDGEREDEFPFRVDPGEEVSLFSRFSVTYEHGHITTNDWYSIRTPYFAVQGQEERIGFLKEPIKEPGIKIMALGDELNTDEKIFISKLLLKNMAKYLTRAVEANVIGKDIKLEVPYASVYPLLYTFISGRQENLPGGAVLDYCRNTWNAIFSFGRIEVRVRKARHDVEWDIRGFWNLQFKDKRRTEIAYAEREGRRTVYLLKYPRDDAEVPPVGADDRWIPTVIKGWEEYMRADGLKTIHGPTCLDAYVLARAFKNFSFIMDHLFNYRLGNVFFIPTWEITDEHIVLRVDPRPLTPARREEALREVTVMNAEVRTEGEKIVIVPTTGRVNEEGNLEGAREVIIYHPEHGILRLPAWRQGWSGWEKITYELYDVPLRVDKYDSY